MASQSFFDTIAVRTGERTEAILEAARDRRINLRRVDNATVGISLDETTERQDVQTLWQIFGGEAERSCRSSEIDRAIPDRIPAALQRAAPFLTHPVFHSYRSETEMLRYMRLRG